MDNFYYIKMSLDGYKVAITGDGGDEMLGGYDYLITKRIKIYL